MADSLEHLTYPLQVGADGALVTAQQGSDAEIESCMAVVLKWPLGTRELDPDFGVPEEQFLTGGANLDEIRVALAHGEPRATETITQDDTQLASFVSAVQVGWNISQSGAGS